MKQKQHNFKVGDRVIVTNSGNGIGNKQIRTPILGTIRILSNDLGIEYDTDIDGHRLDGSIKSSNGWYTPLSCVKLLNKQLEFVFE